MSRFQQLLHDYVALRQRLGFRFRKNHGTLREFVCFLERERATRITTDLVVRWTRLPQGCHPNWWAERYSVARAFAAYCRMTLPRTEVPPAGLFQHRQQRPSPYLYDDVDVAKILRAARQLSGGAGLRPRTYHTFFGLLAAAGLRAREGLNLDTQDVDLQRGLLTVRDTKFQKSRLVPVHASTFRALRQYARQRDALVRTSAFFVHQDGRRLSYAAAYATFHQLLREVGLRTASDHRGPRLHDLRHTFAVRTLIRWYRAGLDVERQLPVLATYLGHGSVEWTYWYLSAAPELLGLAGARLELTLGELP